MELKTWLKDHKDLLGIVLFFVCGVVMMFTAMIVMSDVYTSELDIYKDRLLNGETGSMLEVLGSDPYADWLRSVVSISMLANLFPCMSAMFVRTKKSRKVCINLLWTLPILFTIITSCFAAYYHIAVIPFVCAVIIGAAIPVLLYFLWVFIYNAYDSMLRHLELKNNTKYGNSRLAGYFILCIIIICGGIGLFSDVITPVIANRYVNIPLLIILTLVAVVPIAIYPRVLNRFYPVLEEGETPETKTKYEQDMQTMVKDSNLRYSPTAILIIIALYLVFMVGVDVHTYFGKMDVYREALAEDGVCEFTDYLRTSALEWWIYGFIGGFGNMIPLFVGGWALCMPADKLKSITKIALGTAIMVFLFPVIGALYAKIPWIGTALLTMINAGIVIVFTFIGLAFRKKKTLGWIIIFALLFLPMFGLYDKLWDFANAHYLDNYQVFFVPAAVALLLIITFSAVMKWYMSKHQGKTPENK